MPAGKNLVEINFKFPDMLAKYKRNWKRILIGMAADIQFNRGMLFDNEGAYNGHKKWQDLKSGENLKIAKNGLKSRMILSRSGALRQSISPSTPDGQPGENGYVKIEGDLKTAVVKVGTMLGYARIHNEGGVVQHPGTDNGFGRGIRIKPHSITIPKRNFTDWNDQDVQGMTCFLKNLASTLNGK